MKGNLSCPCGCGMTLAVRMEFFLKSLERFMWEKHYPKYELTVNSGARCEKHNKAIGGSPNSAHIQGLAADIYCPNNHIKWLMKDHIYKCGIKRIGDGVAKGKFIHIDMAIGKVPVPRPGLTDYPQETEWTY